MTESSTTATALLDSAEAAFAEHGIDNVSLRAIMRAAGANPAAVHYHFGSRQALAKAVLDRVLAPLQQRRLDLLSELTTRGRPSPSVPDLIRCLIRPDLEAVVDIEQRNPDGAGLIGAIYCRPSDFTQSLVEQSFRPVAVRFFPYVAAALPHLEPDELSWRIRWCVFGQLGAILSDADFRLDPATFEQTLQRITTVMSGALEAPDEGSQPQP